MKSKFTRNIFCRFNMFYISLFVVVGSLLLLWPVFSVMGQSDVTDPGSSDNITPPGSSGDITGSDTTITVDLKNPIDAKTLSEFVKAILDIVLTIGIPIVALAIIYSGFLFVTARGNEEKLKTAKQTFLWVIIGAAILLGAWVLAQAIGKTIGEIRSTV